MTVKPWICKDGRKAYPLRCVRCGKRSNTSDKETAQMQRWVCRMCAEILKVRREAKEDLARQEELEATEEAEKELKRSWWKRFLGLFC